LSEGRFASRRKARAETGTCDKAKVHVVKKHKSLKPGWYTIGAGVRPRNGALIKPYYLNIGKIPEMARSMFLNRDAPIVVKMMMMLKPRMVMMMMTQKKSVSCRGRSRRSWQFQSGNPGEARRGRIV
jgi:hypothetical protein